MLNNFHTPGDRLLHAGRASLAYAQTAMINRTKFLREAPVEFYRQLYANLESFINRAARLKLSPLVRLNVASDLDFLSVARDFPRITFYDYSKVFSRANSDSLPENYQITFSRSEKTANEKLTSILSKGRNVAVVFDVEYNP